MKKLFKYLFIVQELLESINKLKLMVLEVYITLKISTENSFIN